VKTEYSRESRERKERGSLREVSTESVVRVTAPYYRTWKGDRRTERFEEKNHSESPDRAYRIQELRRLGEGSTGCL